MKCFTIERYSLLSQDKIFKISTDVENFHNLMPKYFKSLIIIKQTHYGKIVIEKIKFLGIPLRIKTKHVIIKPNMHEIHILSGPTSGTIFTEKYIQSGNGTMISINVHLVLNGVFRIFAFLDNYLVKKMSKTMDEFIESAEKHHLS